MPAAPKPDPGLEALLEYLKRARGFDFTSYKRASLARRVTKRLEALGLKGFAEYQDHLEVHPEEFGHLFNAILINVTSFFRDTEPWDYLRDKVIPDILAGKGGDEPVRVWSAGCASGEEAYSLAMLLAEVMGAPGYRARVKIYATDASEAALSRARAASYGEREMADVPPGLRSKYFKPGAGAFVVDADLRRAVVFGRHDLINDSPMSKIDLILCCNTLMYFNSETQARILQRFHFALAERGYLMLGKAEMLLSGGNLFVPVDQKRRVWRRAPAAGERAWLLSPRIRASSPGDAGPGSRRDRPGSGGGEAAAALGEAAVRGASMAVALVDAHGALVMANDQARSLFNIGVADLGRPFSELSMFYRPVELAPVFQKVLGTGAAATVSDVQWSRPGETEPRYYELTVAPLLDGDGPPLGLSVAFSEVTRYLELETRLRESNQALETAQEELQTTNEELQSTVEELETTNEELQSTNEELETMNEELQSTNVELRHSNDELRNRSEQLERVEAFWRSVLDGHPAGIAVLDHESRVQVWTTRAEDLWGVRAGEARGKHFLDLDIGLPLDSVRGPLREAQAGRRPARLHLPATNRKGKAIGCRVDLTPLKRVGAGNGVLVLMQEEGESPHAVREGGSPGHDGAATPLRS